MVFPWYRRKNLVLPLMLAACIAAVDLASPSFEWMEQQSVNLRFRFLTSWPEEAMDTAARKVALIAVTDSSLQSQEFRRASGPPWPRHMYARLLDQLKVAGARAVVFDVVFHSDGPGTAELAQAARRFGSVVWAADWTSGEAPRLNLPADSLLQASPHVGASRAPHSDDSALIESVDPVVPHGQGWVPGLALAASQTAGYQQPPLEHWPGRPWLLRKPPARLESLPINFTGMDAPGGLQPIPFEAVLAGVANQPVLRASLADRIVLVGDATSVSQDTHQTPIGPLPGVHAQGQALVTLLAGRMPHVPARAWTWAWIAAAACLGYLLAFRARWRSFLPLGLASVCVAFLLALWMLGRFQLLVPLAAPSVAFMMAGVAGLSLRGSRTQEEQQRLQSRLGHYESPLLSGGEPPSGAVALVMTDIVESSVMSQRYGGAFETVRRRHFEILRELCRQFNGFEVDDSGGDGLFAVFSSATDATRFAGEVQAQMAAEIWTLPVPSLLLRVGLHWGEPERYIDRNRYKYRGDATNRVARIVRSARPGFTNVSRAILEQVEREGGEMPPYRSAGEVELKGLGVAELYEMIPVSDFGTSAVSGPAP